MSRTVAIDYGAKRCGLAISDPLGMIANGLPTAVTKDLLMRLTSLYVSHGFETIVVGQPYRASGALSEIETEILKAIVRIQAAFPSVTIKRYDERFTSKIASRALIDAGATKKQRMEKGNVDKVSATLLLQEYLNSV